MSYSKCQKYWRTYKTFIKYFEQFYCALIFNVHLMMVDGCNFAQLTARTYRAMYMYFNCAALQVAHYFKKDENLLRSYT